MIATEIRSNAIRLKKKSLTTKSNFIEFSFYRVWKESYHYKTKNKLKSLLSKMENPNDKNFSANS